jgi:hypothetical protein
MWIMKRIVDTMRRRRSHIRWNSNRSSFSLLILLSFAFCHFIQFYSCLHFLWCWENLHK